jgi:hypothetical protein
VTLVRTGPVRRRDPLSSVGTIGQRRRISIAGQRPFTVTALDGAAARREVRIPPEFCAGRVLAELDMEVRKSPKWGNAFGATATTLGGLLAICWQELSQQDPWKAFSLVGVTGIEPVTSAV